MNKNTCKLCMQSDSILIDIFHDHCDKSLRIATVIEKHFPSADANFQGTSNYICTECWNKLKDFHLFYLYIKEIHESMRESVLLHSVDVEHEIEYIKLENTFVLLTDCKDEKICIKPDIPDIKLEDDNNDADITVDIKCNIPVKENFEITKSPDFNVFDDNNDNDHFSNDTDDADDYIELPTPKIPTTEMKKKLRTSTLTQKPKLIIKKKKKVKKIVIPKVRQKKEVVPKENLIKIRLAEDLELFKEFCDMTCDLCSASFDTNGLIEARKHYQEVHDKTGYLRCCKLKFYQRKILINHIEIHKNPDKCYPCTECNRKYLTKKGIQDHVKQRHSTEIWKFNCEKCSKRFPTSTRLAKHLHVHMPIHERKFLCDVCNKAFGTLDSLNLHQKIHQNNEFICEICARIFKNINNLRHHVKYEHTDKELLKTQCDVCGKWLSNDHSVRQHKRRIHNAVKEDLQCPYCGKIKTNKSYLKRHIDVAHGERKFKCSLCDKSFRRQLCLTEHLAVHTGENLYTCTFCTQTFKSSANMYAHRKKAHSEQYTEHVNNQYINKEIGSTTLIPIDFRGD